MTIEIITPTVEVIDIAQLMNTLPNKNDIVSPCSLLPEYVGRVCFNSYDKLDVDSYLNFNKKGANDAHRSLFEFNNVKVTCSMTQEHQLNQLASFIKDCRFLKFDINESMTNVGTYIGVVNLYGSIRAYIEILEQYLRGDTPEAPPQLYLTLVNVLHSCAKSIFTNWVTYDEIISMYYVYDNVISAYCHRYIDITSSIKLKRNKYNKILIKIISDRGLHNELVRHRMAVFMAESQRYVRYGIGENSKNPFKICIASIHNDDEYYKKLLLDSSQVGFNTYKMLLDAKYKAQVARASLPIATAITYFIYTDIEELYHIASLREASSALPMAQEVAKEIHNQLINKHLI